MFLHVLKRTLPRCAFSGMMIFVSGPSDAGPSLNGHSITMHWTEVIEVVRNHVGRRNGSPVWETPASARIYVSTKGRIFGEADRSAASRYRQANKTQSPDDNEDVDDFDWRFGDNVHWQVSGNIVTGTQRFISGARQIRATIDQGNSACQLEVVFGKLDGPIIFQVRRGAMQVKSWTVSDAQCEVSEGNVFDTNN